MDKVSVGLYGSNGHQIQRLLDNHPGARLVAVAGIEPASLPPGLATVRRHDSLQALLVDDEVELISLCSPMRSEQAQHAMDAMQAGKHVYAEKPCAFTEAELDAIISVSRRTGMQFHEMAGTVVQEPYRTMRDQVQSGVVGQVVQVLAQKCYPWHDRRPADERIDGGLARQVGVYIGRFVEHVAGVKIASMRLVETRLGNPARDSDCRRAASFLMTLANGGVASGVCNYLNPVKELGWGYEILRIFGTQGIIESDLLAGTARLLLPGEGPRLLATSGPSGDYFGLYVDMLRGRGSMPLSLEDELGPTRWVARAKDAVS